MQVFEMAPSGGRWIWAVVLLVLLTTALAVAFVMMAARTPRFEVTAEGLHIRGNVYGRFVPASQLRLDDARLIDLDATPELQPRFRTNGMAVPGFQAGWFRLRNGDKSLVFVAGSRRAAHIPTTAGYSLLLAPEDPAGLLAALRTPGR